MQTLQPFKFLLHVAGEDVPVEAAVVGTGPQGEGDVSAVFGRGVLQRFSACHGTCPGQVVGVERGKTLAAVSTFGYSEDKQFIRIDVPGY